MMTGAEFKEKIKYARGIENGIKDLMKKIRKIEENSKSVRDSVHGSSSTFPYTEHSFSIEGIEHNPLLEKRRRLLKKKQKELETLKYDLEEYINTQIKDERMRQLLEYKYIDDYSWVKLAHKMNGTEDALRMEVKRFLEKI